MKKVDIKNNSIHLLVVEDEPFLRDLLLMKFGEENYSVLHAIDGQNALKLAIDEKPDIILLDLLLPGISGFEVLEKLKAQKETRNIPVIILSNLGQEEDVDRCMSIGADSFLVKAHSNPSVIINKVRSVMANHKK